MLPLIQVGGGGGSAFCGNPGGGVLYPKPDLGPGLGFSTNNTIAATANRVYMLQFVCEQLQKIAAFTFATGSGAGITAGNNFGLGIYSEDGLTKLTSINVAGVIAVSTGVRTTVTPVFLTPGVYWLTWVSTITTPTMNAFSMSANTGLVGGLTGSTKRWGFNNALGNTSAGGVLPATLNLPDTILAQNFPLIMCEPS